MELWVDKHKPMKAVEISGQGKAIKEVIEFIDNWSPGKAAFLVGPPGVGKTLTVEAVARERGRTLLRLNASDSRTASEIESMLGSASTTMDMFGLGRVILIDEVDGISGQERGAVGSILKIIRQSRYPVFVIANDMWAQKLAPLRAASRVIKFGKVPSPSVEKRLRDILKAEGIEAPEEVLKSLARFSQGDLRSAVSDLQTVASGRKSLAPADLEILGFREREMNIFSALPVIFHSRRISATRKAINDMDKDPDEVFWWIESNIHQEIDPARLREAYELMSRADVMRSRIRVQQNWRFRALMTDLMSGISVVKGDTHRPPGFRPYEHPTRIAMLGRSRAARGARDLVKARIASHTHCSRRIVSRDYLPYLRMILSSNTSGSGNGLAFGKEEIAAIA